MQASKGSPRAQHEGRTLTHHRHAGAELQKTEDEPKALRAPTEEKTRSL